MIERPVTSLCPLIGILLIAVLSGSVFSRDEGKVMSAKISKLARQLEAAKPIEVDAIVSSFMDENRGAFPLIEDSLVTFLYYGVVGLRATVPSDINRWDVKAHEMAPLGRSDLYYLTLAMPMDARIDYKFYVDGLWMLDPLNPETVEGGFGDNSAFSMPDYVAPPEIQEIDSIPHGTIETHDFESKIIQGLRQIHVYLPHIYGGDDYPVVFVQDGGEYITLASMVNVLDNLIFQDLILPVVAVFIDPVDRNYEYFLNVDYERMLVEEIMPFVRARYRLAGDPAETAIMGASLGGAISLMIAMDHPEVFGNCGSQSGAFEVDQARLLKVAKESPRQPINIYLDCGRFGDLTPENRQMRDILKAKGYMYEYQEFNEGHSWGNWRAHIDDMLVFFWGKEVEKK
jgi:enterochelin esterase-like enzyme